MRRRCRTRENYKRKGILIDPRWDDFETFARDVGPRPPGKTLERKNNLMGYGPENCTWATPREQQNNMERNHILEHRGERYSIAEWARRTGLSYPCIQHRIERGWSIERTLTTPPVIDRRKQWPHG